MQGRLKQLDILRTLAVVLVLGHHWVYYVPGRETIFRWFWRRAGWSGVDLFFVLSGFLVSGLLFREYRSYGRIDIRRFLIRRGLKIYPGFYVLIIISAIAIHLGFWEGKTYHLHSLIAECIFLQNYFGGVWNHTWSLAVEEHFYLILGLSVFFITRRRSLAGNIRRAAIFTVSICLLCLCFRGGYGLFFDYSWRAIYASTHTRLDALLFGVFLSYVYHFRRRDLDRFVLRNKSFLLLGGIILACTPLIFDQHGLVMFTIGLTCLIAGFGSILIVMVVQGEKSRRPSSILNFVSYLGQHSYSIYLWHMPVLCTIKSNMISHLVGRQLSGFEMLLAYIIGAFAVGIIMAKLVELPVIHIRDRFFPSHSGIRRQRTEQQSLEPEYAGKA